ncbi:MAG: Flp pilus assembly protein TadD [Acidobacteria bacterium]|nr:Flp pilus assembly protein TadD [Acidobacteriota bacterium]
MDRGDEEHYQGVVIFLQVAILRPLLFRQAAFSRMISGVGLSVLQSLPAAAFLAIAVTVAAAPPGYVDDAACAPCHTGIVRSYHHVGMSKSFYRPRADDVIEDFGKPPFRHERSGDVMELRWRKGRLVFRRWQVDASGKAINTFEQLVDWILGSGHHARTYLFQTPNGELYQLPLAWYSQTKEWAMAPGYDRRDHQGVLRRARVECLFCHNAYPDLAANARDGYWRSQGLPAHLPEGIGCQRCHGPGAEHVRRASSAESDAAVKAAIVNPARLDASLRRDVCHQCHMQPSVAIPGIRRFGRDIDSFQPGQPLSSYLLRVDITDAGIARDDRFEINHHPYRLEQSRCFRESVGRLSCLSCHDPHRKVAESGRAAHYRAVCLGCHTDAHRLTEDCVSCHMPKRRTQDVVHVVMTDHKISRRPAAGLLAPRQEREPVLENIELADADVAPAEGELYRVVAAMRAGSGQDAARRLEQLLAATAPPHIEPYFDLAAAQLRQKRAGAVETTAGLILDRAPNHPLALEWLGFAQVPGDGNAAIESLREAARLDPLRVETQFNLGLELAARGDRGEAAACFERALAGRPNFVLAWIHLGDLRGGDAAIAAYRRALEIDPTSTRAYVALARALRARGNDREALRYLRHGATFAAKPEVVRAEMK